VVGVFVASEFEGAVQVLDDVALLLRMAEGTLMGSSIFSGVFPFMLLISAVG
jgi:hypothetical protein